MTNCRPRCRQHRSSHAVSCNQCAHIAARDLRCKLARYLLMWTGCLQAGPFLAPTEEDRAEARRRRPRFTLTDAASLAESVLAALGDPLPASAAPAAVLDGSAAPPPAQQASGQLPLRPASQPLQLPPPAPQLTETTAMDAPGDVTAFEGPATMEMNALHRASMVTPRQAAEDGGAAAAAPPQLVASELAFTDWQGHGAVPLVADATAAAALGAEPHKTGAFLPPVEVRRANGSGSPAGDPDAVQPSPVQPSVSSYPAAATAAMDGLAGTAPTSGVVRHATGSSLVKAHVDAHATNTSAVPPAPAFLLPAPDFTSASVLGPVGAPAAVRSAISPAVGPPAGGAKPPSTAPATTAGPVFGSGAVSGPASAQSALTTAEPLASSEHGGSAPAGSVSADGAAAPHRIPALAAWVPGAVADHTPAISITSPAGAAAVLSAPGTSMAPDRGVALEAEVARLRADMAVRARSWEERERRLAEVRGCHGGTTIS